MVPAATGVENQTVVWGSIRVEARAEQVAARSPSACGGDAGLARMARGNKKRAQGQGEERRMVR